MHRLQGGSFLRTLTHLVRRFFGTVFAESLNAEERTQISQALDPALAARFFSMATGDQRHAFTVWKRTGRDPSLAQAALLHDVGKAFSQLGAVSRAAATSAELLRIPTRGRWRAYLDHGEIGANILAEAGADDLAVSFARFHPGPVPPGIDPAAWHRLATADDA